MLKLGVLWAGHVGRDLVFHGRHAEFEGWLRRTSWIGLRQQEKAEGPVRSHTSIIPTTRQAEAGRSLDHRSSRSG